MKLVSGQLGLDVNWHVIRRSERVDRVKEVVRLLVQQNAPDEMVPVVASDRYQGGLVDSAMVLVVRRNRGQDGAWLFPADRGLDDLHQVGEPFVVPVDCEISCLPGEPQQPGNRPDLPDALLPRHHMELIDAQIQHMAGSTEERRTAEHLVVRMW
jgi:hypothetical protein